MVIGVADEQVIVGIHGNALRIVEFLLRGWAITAVTAAAIARHRVDDSGSDVNLADAAVVFVSDEEIPRGVSGHSGRITKESINRGAAVTSVGALSSNAGDGVDNAVRDFADHVIRAIGDVHVVLAIHVDAVRAIQFGAGGWAAVAIVAALRASAVDD